MYFVTRVRNSREHETPNKFNANKLESGSRLLLKHLSKEFKGKQKL